MQGRGPAVPRSGLLEVGRQRRQQMLLPDSGAKLDSDR
jgi:hypothetical protein